MENTTFQTIPAGTKFLYMGREYIKTSPFYAKVVLASWTDSFFNTVKSGDTHTLSPLTTIKPL